MPNEYDIGEFASVVFDEEPESKTFRITVEGPAKYAALLANKIGNLKISEEEVREWCDRD